MRDLVLIRKLIWEDIKRTAMRSALGERIRWELSKRRLQKLFRQLQVEQAIEASQAFPYNHLGHVQPANDADLEDNT